jgi:hypothetical protein
LCTVVRPWRRTVWGYKDVSTQYSIPDLTDDDLANILENLRG